MQFHSTEFEQTEVKVRTLDEMLESAGVERLDFVTIDVEGHEVEALRGFHLARWRPRLVLVEDGSMGSDLAVRREMKRQGYRRFMTTGCNDWYAAEFDRELLTPRSIWRDRVRIAHSRLIGTLEKLAGRKPDPAA